MAKELFKTKDCIIKPIEDKNLTGTFEVYKQVEDFLSLGPVPKASIEMVNADIKHSKESGGIFCAIHDINGDQIGVIDFVPNNKKGTTFLSLLMIAKKDRNKGYGSAIMESLESYLIHEYGTKIIESGVQINNVAGLGFWKRCGFEINRIANALDDGTVAYEMRKVIVPIA